MQQGATQRFLDWGTIKSIAKKSVLLLCLDNVKQPEQRFPTERAVFVRCEGDQVHELYGSIRNISSGGAFFEAEQEIPVGTKVELSFTLPKEPAGEDIFRCAGTVVHVKSVTESKFGIGVKISKSEIVS